MINSADIWETSKTYTESGVTVNLPQAVDMNHRDILVEIDYMSHHIPTAASLNIVVNKFNTFELVNPDGTLGIRLHYVIDDNVPHKTCINVYEDSDLDPTNDFKNIKEDFMGNQTERSSTPNFYQLKWISSTMRCLFILDVVKNQARALLKIPVMI